MLYNYIGDYMKKDLTIKERIIKEIPFIIFIILIILIKTYIIAPANVVGDSMLPNFHNGEILLLNKIDHNYKIFDVVVIKHKESYIIKRIIGLPGDDVVYKNNKLYINGELIENDITSYNTKDFSLTEKVPVDSYFILGDNRTNSLDSRVMGFINKQDIVGKVNIRLFPFDKIGMIK